jgi:hypothetical protein
MNADRKTEEQELNHKGHEGTVRENQTLNCGGDGGTRV